MNAHTTNTMSHDIRPYSGPNPIDTLLNIDLKTRKAMPASQYRTAEILACLQTLDDALRELEGRSTRRAAAAETWRELAADIVQALPTSHVRTHDRRDSFDPFERVRLKYPPSGNPLAFRRDLMGILNLMLAATRVVLGEGKRYVDNYHGIICFQLRHLQLIGKADCELFHREFIDLPEPNSCENTGLVHHNMDASPRGGENDYDLTEYHQFMF